MLLKVADDLHLMQQHSLAGHQTGEGGATEQQDTIEHAHDFGFTNVPMAQVEGAVAAAEAFVLSMGGNRSHNIVIKMGDRRFRLFGLDPGDVALHQTDGQQVHLSKTGTVVSTPNDKSVTVQVMAKKGMPPPPQTNNAQGQQQPSSGGSQQQMGQGKQQGLDSVSSFFADATKVFAQFGPAGKPTTTMKVDANHAVIRHVSSGNTLWADEHGVFSSAPIQVAKYPYKDP